MATRKFLFIIGAPKAGTTSFATWLGSDDRFYLPRVKEPGFFRDRQESYILNARGARSSSLINFDKEKYLALFAASRQDQWAIDASTDYLSCENAAARIKEFSEGREVKVVCILRDPVERAFSEYQHTLRDGLETRSFRKSIELEPQRRIKGYQPLFFHLRRSQYYADICRYRALFGDDLLLLDFQWLETPSVILEKISQFLDVDIEMPGTPPVLNASKSYTLNSVREFINHRLVRGAARQLFGQRTRDAVRLKISSLFRRSMTLSEADRRLIAEHLKDDIIACLNAPEIPTASWTAANYVDGDAARVKSS